MEAKGANFKGSNAIKLTSSMWQAIDTYKKEKEEIAALNIANENLNAERLQIDMDKEKMNNQINSEDKKEAKEAQKIFKGYEKDIEKLEHTIDQNNKKITKIEEKLNKIVISGAQIKDFPGLLLDNEIDNPIAPADLPEVEPIIGPNPIEVNIEPNIPVDVPSQSIEPVNTSPVIEPIVSDYNVQVPPVEVINQNDPIEAPVTNIPTTDYTPDYSFENELPQETHNQVDHLIEEIEAPKETSQEMIDKLWSELKVLSNEQIPNTNVTSDNDLTHYKNYNDYIFGFGKKHYGKEALTAEEIDALSSITGFLSESEFEKNKNSQFNVIIDENNNLKNTINDLTNQTNSLNEKLNSQNQTINELQNQIANLKQIEEKFNTLSNLFRQNV